MNPKSGNPGEAAVLNALVQRGFGVLLPFGEGHPFDLVVVVEGAFLRVQCKTAWRRGGCLAFNSHATDHGRGQLSYVGRADLFGVFYPSTSGVYLVPVGLNDSEIYLRVEPTRNNQRRRVRWAADYEVGRWSPDGLLAVVGGAVAA
jgi:PD-(D/E)XK endonuclease